MIGLFWYPFDPKFQTPTGLEIHPSVARCDPAHSSSMKALVAAARESDGPFAALAERWSVVSQKL
jgi:hypothetical protein